MAPKNIQIQNYRWLLKTIKEQKKNKPRNIWITINQFRELEAKLNNKG